MPSGSGRLHPLTRSANVQHYFAVNMAVLALLQGLHCLLKRVDTLDGHLEIASIDELVDLPQQLCGWMHQANIGRLPPGWAGQPLSRARSLRRGGARAIRSRETMATWGMRGKTNNLDNYLSDVGRNSQPAKWAADSRTPHCSEWPSIGEAGYMGASL
jgi:hypothetical protein